MAFELKVLDMLQNIRTPFLDDFMVTVTKLGDAGWIWIILTALLLINKPTRKIGFMCAFALLIGALVTNITLKPLVARLRPYTHRDMMILIDQPKDFSFPSGHTTASFAFAFVCLMQKPKSWLSYLILIVASLVAFTRLYLYVHFPSDIVVAILIAFVAAKVSIYFANKYKDFLKLH